MADVFKSFQFYPVNAILSKQTVNNSCLYQNWRCYILSILKTNLSFEELGDTCFFCPLM